MISEAYNNDEGFDEFANSNPIPGENPEHTVHTHNEMCGTITHYPFYQIETKNYKSDNVPQYTNYIQTSTIGQSRMHSLGESVLNVAIGYFISMAAQLIIFPIYDIHISMSDNIAIGLWFTVVSIIRSYCIRRYFNRVTVK